MVSIKDLSSIVPTREFRLIVDPVLLPFADAPRKGYSSFQVSGGKWFNTRARLPATKSLQLQYAKAIDKHIKDLVQAEARKLQNFWRSKIPQFFNRRSYGMFFSKKNYPERTYKYKRQTKGTKPVKVSYERSMKKFSGPYIRGDYLWKTRGSPIEKKYTNRQQFSGRTRTGQLRRALEPKNVTVAGCKLVVKPCYASTGKRVDYVNVLMTGAHAQWGRPYVPEMDRRIKAKSGRWGGISPMYWRRWQFEFQKQVEISNQRLHNRILEYLTKMKVYNKADAGRIYRGSRRDKEITKENARRKSRKGTAGGTYVPNSPYNKTRSGKSYGSRSNNIKRTPWEYDRNPYNIL